MLKNVDTYSKTFLIPKQATNKHPENIYFNPINGMMYFIRADSLASDFGFPRLDVKKPYKWKKGGFTTDLPKRKGLVTYLVVSSKKVIQNNEDPESC